MRRWLPRTAMLAASLGLLAAVAAGGVALQAAVKPADSRPVALKSVTPGALEAAGVHLSTAAQSPLCRLPSDFHRLLAGDCAVSRSAAVGAAIRALPPDPVTKATAAVVEAVLVRADVPAGLTKSGLPLHALVWVVAVKRNTNFAPSCACCGPPNALEIWCGGASRMLVLVDAVSASALAVWRRP